MNEPGKVTLSEKFGRVAHELRVLAEQTKAIAGREGVGMTDDDLTALERNAAGVPWVAGLVAEVRRLRAAVAWHEKELAAERAGVRLTEEVERKLLADRGIRREPKSTPAVTLAAEVDRLRAAVAAERGWAAGVAEATTVKLVAYGSDRLAFAVENMARLRAEIAAAIRRGPEPTEGV